MNESNQNLPPALYDDEIDLGELFRVLWAGKWLISSITVAAAVLSVIVALLLPNVYRAEALLAPNDEEGAGGLSALAAQYGGLASLAGISLGGGQADKTALGLEVLKSRRFITEFIDRHEVLVPLMATRRWDSASGDLEIDSDLYDSASGKWIRDVSPPKNAVPSSQEAYGEFMDLLFVSQDKKTGFVTVAVEHYSPVVAKQWVDWLVHDINAEVMHEDVKQAEQAIDYLEGQVKVTSLAGLQNVFFRLIEEQTKTMMLARASPEYLFRTIDPAVVPELKAGPRRTWIALSGMLIGGMLGAIVVLVIARVSPRRK